MITATATMAASGGGGGGGAEPPGSIFTGLYEWFSHTAAGEWFGFAEYDKASPHAGQFQFEGLCFALLIAAGLSALVILSTRDYQRIPSKLRNFLEVCFEGLRNLVRMLMGPQGDRHLPFLGTLFIYILLLNLIGLIPAARSPSITLSTTLALGISTFFVVQYSAIKANGVKGHIKHLMGPVLVLAPLMLPIEILGELIKPISLSLRLRGNIGGEDVLIEQLLAMGGWIPLQAPMLIFGVFTSFLQAFIFTALSAIYIQIASAHGGEEEHHPHHG